MFGRGTRTCRPNWRAHVSLPLLSLGVLGLSLALHLTGVSGADDDVSDDPAHRVFAPQVARDGLPPTPTATATPTATPVPAGPALYLTFDDGPDSVWTPIIRGILARYGAKATFFVIGQQVDAMPWLTAANAAESHAIGIHTYRHSLLTLLPRSAVWDELASAQGAIVDSTGKSTNCFRPPYGAINATVAEVAASQGLTTWLWTVDPGDWRRPGVQAIVDNVRATAGPGSIVLLHDGGGDRSQTAAALEQILADFSRRGYRFLPLPCHEVGPLSPPSIAAPMRISATPAPLPSAPGGP